MSARVDGEGRQPVLRIDIQAEIAEFCSREPRLRLLLTAIEADRNSFWLVGGCLRDLLLGRTWGDLDIVADCDPSTLAKDWARRVKGKWFWLDQDRLYSRVLLSKQLHVDFSPLRAATLEADLKLRDFTINSLALPLQRELSQARLIDPLAGLEHLRQGLLVPSAPTSFADDPLRLLKGIRHAVTLNLRLSEKTCQEVRDYAHLLNQVAGERIRDELLLILGSSEPIRGLQMMARTGLLRVLLGACVTRLDCDTVWSSLKSFSARLQLLTTVNDLLSSVTETRALLLLAELFRITQPMKFDQLLQQKLRLSRYQQRLLHKLTDPQLEKLVDIEQLCRIEGGRRQALAIECLQPCAWEKMLYCGLAGGEQQLVILAKRYKAFLSEAHYGRVPDLLNGTQVARLTGAAPRQLGQWQKRIKWAEINQEITSPAAAERWLKNAIDSKNDS